MTFIVGDITDLPTESDARAAADRVARQHSAATAAGPGRAIGVLRYLSAFCAGRLKVMRPTTRTAYSSIINLHLRPAFPGLRMDQVDSAAVQQLIDRLCADGLAPSFITNVVKTWRAIARSALIDGYAVGTIDNRALRLPAQRTPAKMARVFTPEELAKLAALPDPWGLAYLLQAQLGLRISELTALRWSNLDPDRRVLHLTHVAVAGELLPYKPAKGFAAVLPLTASAVKRLQAYRGAWRHNELDLLFPSARGLITSRTIYWQQLHKACDRLGISRGSAESFRLGAAALLLERGVSPRTVHESLRLWNLPNVEAPRVVSDAVRSTLELLDQAARR